MQTTPLIQFEGLNKTFGRGSKSVDAVIDLDLSISPGQVYGFLGQNGAGKTTTIRLMLGLIHPTRGRALISGEDVQKDPAVLRGVGSIVEDPQFYNFMSGRDNLLSLIYTGGEKPTSRLDELLNRVGLSERASQLVSGYSKGMRQRLGLAAALLRDPELIILDEPTNGLDPKGMGDMRALIRELVEVDGKTVFISSHLLNEVEQVCDRVAIIHQGRIVQEGLVSELLEGESASLRIQATPIPDALAALGPHWKALAEPGSDWIQVQAPAQAAPEIVRQLVKAGIDLHQVEAQTQSLEDFFLQVTEEDIFNV